MTSSLPENLVELARDDQDVGCCSVRYSYLKEGRSCYVAQMLRQSVLRTLKPLFAMPCLSLLGPERNTFQVRSILYTR